MLSSGYTNVCPSHHALPLAKNLVLPVHLQMAIVGIVLITNHQVCFAPWLIILNAFYYICPEVVVSAFVINSQLIFNYTVTVNQNTTSIIVMPIIVPIVGFNKIKGYSFVKKEKTVVP